MQFVRYVDKNDKNSEHPRFGVLDGQTIREIEGEPVKEWKETGRTVKVEDVRLLAPIVPHQIIGIGKNFVGPNETKPEKLPDIPVFFFKPPTSVIGPDEDIVLPDSVDEVKFEAELAVVIGKKAHHITPEQVHDCIFGYTVANDVTATSLFHPEGHWTLGKAADTFTPLGPILVTDLDENEVRIRSLLNGEEKQNSGLDNIIIDIPTMVSYLSQIMTLYPGDVILTGAPYGAEMMMEGDTIECIVEPIGSLKNRVVRRQAK